MSTFRFGRQTAGLVKLTACALMLMFCIVFGLVTGCSNGSPEPAIRTATR